MPDAYACHCEECGGMMAVCVSDIPDLDEVLAEWAKQDNSYIERHDLETAKKLPFCDVAWTDGKKSHA